MSDFNQAWFVAAGLRLLAICAGFMVPGLRRQLIGRIALGLGVLFLLVGTGGLARDLLAPSHHPTKVAQSILAEPIWIPDDVGPDYLIGLYGRRTTPTHRSI